MGVIFTILFFTELVITILTYLFIFIRFVACRHKHQCQNDNCPARAYCAKTARSELEKEEIRKLKEELQKLSNSSL